ncbi:MAG: hypothetical protein ACJ72Q_17625 [Nitrososphaeraceae archaeon]
MANFIKLSAIGILLLILLSTVMSSSSSSAPLAKDERYTIAMKSKRGVEMEFAKLSR